MITMMLWYGSHLVFWQAALMWVGMTAFLGVLIWPVYALVTSATRRPGSNQRGPDASRILDERLARGEIDTAEYQRLRDLITAGHQQELTDSASGR
jgi:putative membrane protein